MDNLKISLDGELLAISGEYNKDCLSEYPSWQLKYFLKELADQDKFEDCIDIQIELQKRKNTVK